MYNELVNLKAKITVARKMIFRSAFIILLVSLVVNFAQLHSQFYEGAFKIGIAVFAVLGILDLAFAFVERGLQRALMHSPFGFGAGSGFNATVHSISGFDSFMNPYLEGMSEKDDLFAPIKEGSTLTPDEEDDSEGVFATFDEGINLEEDRSEEDKDKDYWKNKIESIPERTIYDFKERATALRDLKEKRFDLLRNEFLAHVFGTPEGNELPEGQDPLTFNPQAYHYGAYFSHALLDMSRGEWLHYQNRLKTLFQDEYRIDFDDECNVSYRLK